MYEPVRVVVAAEQRDKLKSIISQKTLPVKIDLRDTSSADTLLLSQRQVASIEKARALGKRKFKTIRMSRRQIEKNRSYQGGYLSLLDFNEDNSGQDDDGANIAGSSTAYDNGFYLIKRGFCMKVYPVQDNGLYLTIAHPLSSYGTYADGLYFKDGQVIKNGEEILTTEYGPFKNYPILNLLL